MQGGQRLDETADTGIDWLYMLKKPKSREDMQIVASNRKARHDYQFLETFEAGICLAGCEIKSLREGKASINESFAHPRDGELFLYGMHIVAYPNARDVPDPVRPRKLLLHKKQIKKLSTMVSQQGLTIVPTQIYLRRSLAKVEIALARGKGRGDKRDDIKKRDAERQIQRALRGRR